MSQPRKRFGQHFLTDSRVIEQILDASALQAGEMVLEIGPGEGAITRPLLRRLGYLQAIELDHDLIPRLEAACRGLGELRIHVGDALKFDFCALVPEGPTRLRLIGNLPYNISTPLIFHVLAQRRCIHDMHFMLQKEVVERMAAPPGGKDYGRLSVMVQLHCRVEPLFDIGPEAFRPPPKVVSSFVRLQPYPTPPWPVSDHRLLAGLVTAAFSARRKTLRNALHQWISIESMQQLGISPQRRPETLEIAEFVALAEAVYNQRATATVPNHILT